MKNLIIDRTDDDSLIWIDTPEGYYGTNKKLNIAVSLTPTSCKLIKDNRHIRLSDFEQHGQFKKDLTLAIKNNIARQEVAFLNLLKKSVTRKVYEITVSIQLDIDRIHSTAFFLLADNHEQVYECLVKDGALDIAFWNEAKKIESGDHYKNLAIEYRAEPSFYLKPEMGDNIYSWAFHSEATQEELDALDRFGMLRRSE